MHIAEGKECFVIINELAMISKKALPKKLRQLFLEAKGEKEKIMLKKGENMFSGQTGLLRYVI